MYINKSIGQTLALITFDDLWYAMNDFTCFTLINTQPAKQTTITCACAMHR